MRFSMAKSNHSWTVDKLDTPPADGIRHNLAWLNSVKCHRPFSLVPAFAMFLMPLCQCIGVPWSQIQASSSLVAIDWGLIQMWILCGPVFSSYRSKYRNINTCSKFSWFLFISQWPVHVLCYLSIDCWPVAIIIYFYLWYVSILKEKYHLPLSKL